MKFHYSRALVKEMEEFELLLKGFDEEMPDIDALNKSTNCCWRILSCFKHTDDMKVYLAENENETQGIVKIASGMRARTLKREYETLKMLNGEAVNGIIPDCEMLDSETLNGAMPDSRVFPNPIGLTENGSHAMLIREYIPGRTLAEHAENSSMGIRTARRLAKQVCGVVTQMHRKGLIHRDLKPHNFIVTPQGNLFLIDMESAQMSLSAHKRMDSMNIATLETAAPEQFGVFRSDERTDVYGIGMLMLYLIASSTDLSDLRRIRGYVGFKRIIRRATAFDPAKRYADVKALEHAIASNGQAPKTAAMALASCMLMSVLISGGSIGARINGEIREAAQISDVTPLQAGDESEAQGKHPSTSADKPDSKESDNTDSDMGLSDLSEPSISDNELATFAEPLIEQAASMQLGIPAGSITLNDVKNLHKLYICADIPFKEWDDAMYLGDLVYKGDGYNKPGNIESLDDLYLMPNLKELALYAQPLSDISAIEDLPLTRLALGGCGNISDFSALNGLQWLEFINIGGTECNALSVFENCEYLTAIWMNRIPATDLSSLVNLPLEALLCDASSIGDPEVLIKFARLKELNVSRPPKGLASVLNRMTNLRALYISGFREEDLTGLADLANLTFLSVNIDSMGYGDLNSLKGIENFPNLQGLDISGTLVSDISPLSNLPFLEELIMHNVPVENYELLLDLPKLRMVRVSQDAAEELLKLNPVFTVERSY
jgi:serine/threonine protein kinase